jgi:hypothetical protein
LPDFACHAGRLKTITVLLDGRRRDGGGVAYLDLDAAGIIVELVQHRT